MKNSFSLFSLLISLLIVPGSPAEAQATSEIVIGKAQNSVLPPPTIVSIDPDEYRIGPLDVLIVDVFDIEGLEARELRVDSSGRLSVPLAGYVEAGGLTPAELASRIGQRLRNAHVRDPRVTVNLKEINSRNVTIEGEVKEPGVYPVLRDMTLLRAIAAAKGTTEFAKQRAVLVVRTVGTQRMAGAYDLRSIRKGIYDDPRIYTDDLVIVGDNAARRFLKDALTIVPAVTTPLILLLRR